MPLRQRRPSGVHKPAVRTVQEAGMTLVDIALLNAALAERDAAREENARLRAAVERARLRTIWRDVASGDIRCELCDEWTDECDTNPCAVGRIRAALAVPTDDGAERGAR